MEINQNNLEEIWLDYMERIKELLAPSVWENVLLDCSKNELLVLFLLYRCGDSNMSRIAEYINVPLNTATGIAGRMEKKEMIVRERSAEDKRVVTVVLAPYGKKLLNEVLEQMMFYGRLIVEDLSSEELAVAGRILDKVLNSLGRRHEAETSSDRHVRKITIE